MEETINTTKLFFYHVFLFGGIIFYALTGLTLGGFLSVGFHRIDSKFETVINQVNPELEAKEVFQEQESHSKPQYKR